MWVYLAGRYSRREELVRVADDLQSAGHYVTSRWLHGGHQISDEGLNAERDEELRTRFAVEDWEDLESADALIAFTEAPRSSTTRGGRHVEFGAALAMGKLCLIVGPRENVFYGLPQVIQCANADEAILKCTEAREAILLRQPF